MSARLRSLAPRPCCCLALPPVVPPQDLKQLLVALLETKTPEWRKLLEAPQQPKQTSKSEEPPPSNSRQPSNPVGNVGLRADATARSPKEAKEAQEAKGGAVAVR